MANKSWTKEQLRILRKEYPGIEHPKNLVKRLGKTLPAIKTKATLLGLKRERQAGSIWTPSLERRLSKLYPNNTNAKIAGRLGVRETQIESKAFKLGLRKTPEFMWKHSMKSAFKKGHVPDNKGKKQTDYMSADAIVRTKSTRFQKGNLPHNAVGFKDGDFGLRPDKTGRIYWYTRLFLGKWYPLHQNMWEQKNGKLPKGHCLWFNDGDSMNCELSNLGLITRAENMRRNSCSIRLTDNYVATAIARKKGKPGHVDRRLVKEIKKNPALIELKRAQMLLNRTIKSKLDVKK